MPENRPSLLRIFTTDFPTFFAAMLALLGWAFILFDLLRGREPNPRFIIGWAVITLAALAVILWRVIPIYTVFNDPQEVKAAITEVGFFRDRGQIKFIYQYQNGKWIGSNYVLKNRRTSKYAVGDEVIVLVDRNQPKKSYIRELFV